MSQTFYNRLGKAIGDRVALHLRPSLKEMELLMSQLTDLVAKLQADFQSLSDSIDAAVAKITAIPGVPQEAIDALTALDQQAEDFKGRLDNASPRLGVGVGAGGPVPPPAPGPAPAPPFPPDQSSA